MKVRNIEPTPNPNALKFNLDGRILESGTRSYDSIEEAAQDPLAIALFSLPAVKTVFFMPSFVTVSKDPGADWSALAGQVTDILEAEAEILPPEPAAAPSSAGPVDEARLRVEEVLNTKIRPALAGDGGGLQILDLQDNLLTIRYHGACGTCPSAISGTLRAIEQMLRAEIRPDMMVVLG